MLYFSFMVCLVEMILGRRERKKMVERGIQLGGEGGKKTGGILVFSPWAYQNPISPNQGDYRRENKVALLLVAFGQIYLSINVQDVLDLLAFFFFFFFLVGSHMFLFSSFFVCFCFFRKQFWASFLCFFIYFHFIEVPIYTQFFLKVYNVLLFVLLNKDMIVNLYKLYFQSFHF